MNYLLIGVAVRLRVSQALEALELTQNENSVIIYSLSCHSKSCIVFFLPWNTKGEILHNIIPTHHVKIGHG